MGLLSEEGSAGTPPPPKPPAGAAAASRVAGPRKAAADGQHRWFSRWPKTRGVRSFVRAFHFPKIQWERLFSGNTSVAQAQSMAARDAKILTALPVDTVARIAYVLDIEASGSAAFLAKAVPGAPDRAEAVKSQTAFYHSRYDVPCGGKVERRGQHWPPHFVCKDAVQKLTGEPLPFVHLNPPPSPILNPPTSASVLEEDRKTDAALASKRKSTLAERDGEKGVVPHENLDVASPSKFCHKGQCFGSYREIAAAIYGAKSRSGAVPVFCAPANTAAAGEAPRWETGKVQCSGEWLDTVGGFAWTRQGKPNYEYRKELIPPYSCIGSPHFFGNHVILPTSGAVGKSDFHCHRRIFRVMVKEAEKSLADQARNIAMMCAEMRMQVWGEKYPRINQQYQDWCRGNQEYMRRGFCLPPGTPLPGDPNAPEIPFFRLSREELLYFFGHRETYCRGDRTGLVHFLDPEHKDKWAQTFTCNVPRGLLEAGPFEEGVQVCSVVPYSGEENAGGSVAPEHLKARMHCWKFERPTCEDISRDQTKDDIHRSNVFDVIDALKAARRTRHADAWGFYDLKDAEKLQNWQDQISFSDTSKDEGTFGVKDFCRFAGHGKKIQCGYTKETISQWYELRSKEEPEACDSGFCTRGAFQRGYYCGLFQSTDFFKTDKEFPKGRPFWMCGVDTGIAGSKILEGAKAICLGGARAKHFQSPKGDKSSLQCYARQFRWGESAKSEDLLRHFDLPAIVKEADKIPPPYDPWLAWQPAPKQQGGGMFGAVFAAMQHITDTMHQTAKNAIIAKIRHDMAELEAWLVHFGHTLGHRTSMRLGFMKSPLTVIREFKSLRFAGTSNEKAKSLSDLRDEVAKGERAADEKWYQNFRLEATEEGKLQIPVDELMTALRMQHVFTVLEAVRKVILEHARRYADEVYSHGRKAPLLSRSELLDRANSSAVPSRFKGNVFCVEEVGGAGEYICSSSALLVAGRVELAVGPPPKSPFSPSAFWGQLFGRLWQQQDAARRDKVRNQVKFGWCYGGEEGRRVLPTEIPAVAEKELSSPFQIDPPASVLAPRRPRRFWLPFRFRKLFQPARKTQELKRPGHAQAGPTGERASSLIASPGLGDAIKKAMRTVGTAVQEAARKNTTRAQWFRNLSELAQKVEFKLPAHGASPSSTIHWLKCSGFSYSDEAWGIADPKKWKELNGPPPEKQTATSAASTDGSGETAKIMSKVGGLLGDLVKLVLPKFASAIDRVKDLAHAASEFYETYVKKFVDKATVVWEKLKAGVDAARKLVEEGKEKLLADAQKAVEAAKDKLHQGELQAAAALGPAKEKALEKVADLKAKHEDAKSAVTGVLATIKDRESSLTAKLKEAWNKKDIDGSGEILSEMLEDLLNIAAQKVTAIIESNARSLMSQGFKFVRSVLDPIAKAVISTLAGIPFVGAGLAALGQVAYSLAMDALENAAFDALMGVVERILTKLLRPVITPVFKAVQGKVLQLAFAVGAAMDKFKEIVPKDGKLKFSALPPRDQWLNRALACGGREIFDDKLYRDAALAHAHILGRVKEMRQQAVALAHDLANRYLGRYGYTVESWVAAVGTHPTPATVARASEIERDLTSIATSLRAKRDEARARER
jgi:hypothetical protein